MARDQRPGTIRIIADPRATTPPSRRHSDAKSGARKVAPKVLPSATGRHWLVIPACLFAIGFIVGGVATAARDLMHWAGL